MYQALYRKWRPRTFDDVISQPHITTTLKNQIQSGKTAHAYLFTGSRGTGKTTCARIFAKAINCLHATDGNPCQQCEICRDAEAFSLSDIIEIDAASNNGVDDIRELRDGAVYTPERCKYKVYIIDEVHMLSQSAFNALLKIMEEPPAFVKFILATTEIHKVPATIVSRCQRFDFRRILPEDITARLLYIAGEEQLTLDAQAARLIARLSDGGMRDALSLLDQCAAYDSNITLDTVSAAAGIAGRDALFDLLDAMTQSDPAKAVRILDELYAKSKDMLRLCEELIAQLRNVMLLHVTNGDTSLLACMPEEITRLEGIRSAMPLQQVIDRLSVLQACNERLGRAINKRVELELCLIRLCSPQISQKSPQTLDNSQIYDKIKQGVSAHPTPGKACGCTGGSCPSGGAEGGYVQAPAGGFQAPCQLGGGACRIQQGESCRVRHTGKFQGIRQWQSAVDLCGKCPVYAAVPTTGACGFPWGLHSAGAGQAICHPGKMQRQKAGDLSGGRIDSKGKQQPDRNGC